MHQVEHETDAAVILHLRPLCRCRPVLLVPIGQLVHLGEVTRTEAEMQQGRCRIGRKVGIFWADLTAALDLGDEFKSLIREQSSGTLQDWLTRAEATLCPEVRHFAQGIRRDESAVNAAITLPWSNGPVEGHVNRLKSIKRQMFEWAGFELLKARVLNAA